MMMEKNITSDLDKLRVEFYLFGSILHKIDVNDLDILIVYSPKCKDDFNQIIYIRKIIKEVLTKILNMPIDIIILTYEEEQELNYKRKTNAIKVNPSYFIGFINDFA